MTVCLPVPVASCCQFLFFLFITHSCELFMFCWADDFLYFGYLFQESGLVGMERHSIECSPVRQEDNVLENHFKYFNFNLLTDKLCECN